MPHIPDEFWKAFWSFAGAALLALGAILTKYRSRSGERRDNTHKLRRTNYELKESYARASHLLGEVARQLELASELRAQGVTVNLHEKLAPMFPHGKAPDFLAQVQEEMKKFEQMQEQFGEEKE